MFKKLSLSAALVVALASQGTVTGPAHAVGTTCGSTPIEATGKAFKKKIRAERSALRTWKRATRRAMGARWDDYRLAKSKQSRCIKTGRQTYCKIRATPCNSGRFRLSDEPGVTN